jgi:hypothetical protein
MKRMFVIFIKQPIVKIIGAVDAGAELATRG